MSQPRRNYPGDSRLLSIATAQYLSGEKATIVLGFQDGSMKHFEVAVKKES